MFRRVLTTAIKVSKNSRAFASTEIAAAGSAAAPVAAKAAPVVKPVSQGSSFLQRLSAFFVGFGVASSLSYYFIYTELTVSNASLEDSLKKLEDRVKALEA